MHASDVMPGEAALLFGPPLPGTEQAAVCLNLSERGDLGTLFTFGMSMAARGPKNMFEPSRGDTVPVDVAVTVTFRLDGKK